MTREPYVKLLQDLLSRDPTRVREANRRLYVSVVESTTPDAERSREADLVLAEVANG